MIKSRNIFKIIIILVAAVLAVLLIFALLSSAERSSKNNTIRVENGKLDLTDWNFAENGNVKLNGDWEFYWNQLITPEEFAEGPHKITGNYPIPVYWTKYKDLNLPSQGQATYRLTINTNMKNEMLAISTPEIFTEYALWINGEMLAGNGSLGGTTIRYHNPHAFTFNTGEGNLEVVLQIRNPEHVNAGVGQKIMLGAPEEMFWSQDMEEGIDLITVGICLFAGIYHFVIYLYRRQDYKILYFTIFCFAVALRSLFTNQIYIMEFLPDLSFSIGSRIVTETIPVILVSMLAYIYYMIDRRIPKWWLQSMTIISGVFFILVLVADTATYSYLFSLYLFVAMAACAMGVYASILAVKKKNRETLLFLIGVFFIIAGAVNDTLVFYQAIDTGYRLGVGLSAFAVIQSFIMAMQYARMTKERAELYEKLHRTDLAFMQAQIKPHFIYNALGAISHSVSKEPEKAKELIVDFSDYLRGCFDFTNTSGLTTLSKELDLVKAYLSLEKARFLERLEVEYQIEENPHVLIPMLCIQPIVENAVHHGIMQRIKGGTVRIKIWKQDNATHILVEDNGVGMTEEKIREIIKEESSAFGLANINGRLKLRFGTELKIKSKINEGTSVEITIPKQAKTIGFEE